MSNAVDAESRRREEFRLQVGGAEHPAAALCRTLPSAEKRWDDIRYLLGSDARSALTADAFRTQYPDAWRNPLSLYEHVYANGNPASRRPDRKIIFIHPQKTAGSTVAYVLRANMQSIGFRNDFTGQRDIAPDLVLRVFDELAPEEQAKEIAKWSAYDALAGHGMYGMHRLLSAPYEYMTILRHPVERFFSYYRFVRMKKYAMQPEETALRERALRLSPMEFCHDPHFGAYLTVFQSYASLFSGYAHPYGKLSLAQNQVMHDMASRHLASVSTVLIAEAFDISMRLLERKFGWRDEVFMGDAAEPRLRRVVGTATREVPVPELSSGDLRDLADFFRFDIALYEQGVEAFIADMRTHGLARELPAQFLSSKQSTPLVRNARSSSVPAGTFSTALGILDFGSIWVDLARDEGMDPLAVDTLARHLLKKERCGVLSLAGLVQVRLGASVPLVHAWLQCFHAENVYAQVVDEDRYGLRALHARGFAPKTIVDIGAHIGIFSAFASSLWPEARILAVEAQEPDVHEEHVLATLRSNTADRPGVSVLRAAIIGMPPGLDTNALLEALNQDTVEHWLERGIRGASRFQNDIASRQIVALSFSSLMEKFHLHNIDLLKLACDGAETNILLECKMLGVLPMIGEIRGRWHGARARAHIPEILAATHHVRMIDGGPSGNEGFFSASPRNDV